MSQFICPFHTNICKAVIQGKAYELFVGKQPKTGASKRRGLSEAERSAYQYSVPTADLSAFAGCSGIPLNLLNLIIGPNRHQPK